MFRPVWPILFYVLYFCAHCFSFVFYHYFVAEKEALQKRVKELEESLATRNVEAEKVAKDVAAREEQFVNGLSYSECAR